MRHAVNLTAKRKTRIQPTLTMPVQERIDAEAKVAEQGNVERLNVALVNPSGDSEDRQPAVTETGFAYRLASRSLDLLVAVPLLVLTVPLILVIAVAVRLDSPGPVLFRHKRVKLNRRAGLIGSDRRSSAAQRADDAMDSGSEQRRSDNPGDRRSENRFGEAFYLYKFRTMYADARDRFPRLYDYEFSEEELNTVPIKVLVGTERGTNGCLKDFEAGHGFRIHVFPLLIKINTRFRS